MCGIHLPALVPSLLCPLDDQHDDDNDDGDHRDGNNVGGDGATHIHICQGRRRFLTIIDAR